MAINRTELKKRFFESIPLIGILGVAFFLRIQAIDFGLPEKYRPDEEYLVFTSLHFLKGNLNPHFFFYPTFYMYILGLVYGLFSLLGTFLEMIGCQPFFHDLHEFGQTPAYLLGRYTTALFGVLGVFSTYWLGKITYHRGIGLLAAGLLASNYIHVRDSHFLTPEVPMTFFMTLALGAMVYVCRRGKIKDYVLAGIFTGLACSVKYTAMVLALPLIVAHLLRIREDNESKGWKRLKPGPILGCGFCAFLAFFATSPFIFFDWAKFWNDFNYNAYLVRDGLPGLKMAYGWRWLFQFALPNAAGFGLMILSLFGVGVAFLETYRKKNSSGLLLVVVIFALFYTLMTSRLIYLRYTVSLMPPMLILAAYSVQRIAENCLPRKTALAVTLFCLTLAAAGPFYRVLQTNKFLGLMREDTRTLAKEWISKHIPSGSKIATHAYYRYGKPQLPTKYEYVDFFDPDKLNFTGPEAVQWVLLDRHPGIPVYSPELPAKAMDFLRKHFTEVIRFQAFDENSTEMPIFDPADAFYIPVGKYAAALRPGTEITIYRLND